MSKKSEKNRPVAHHHSYMDVMLQNEGHYRDNTESEKILRLAVSWHDSTIFIDSHVVDDKDNCTRVECI